MRSDITAEDAEMQQAASGQTWEAEALPKILALLLGTGQGFLDDILAIPPGYGSFHWRQLAASHDIQHLSPQEVLDLVRQHIAA